MNFRSIILSDKLDKHTVRQTYCNVQYHRTEPMWKPFAVKCPIAQNINYVILLYMNKYKRLMFRACLNIQKINNQFLIIPILLNLKVSFIKASKDVIKYPLILDRCHTIPCFVWTLTVSLI